VDIRKIPLELLVPHEEYREERVLELLEEIRRDGYLMRPIAVSSLQRFGLNMYLIHDGHHRTECMRRLGLKYVTANVIDFGDETIQVRSWADGSTFPKEKVLELALSGRKVPPKVTKHVIVEDGRDVPFADNDLVEPRIFESLENLK